jgi:DNA transposition AAA+ family ATPase
MTKVIIDLFIVIKKLSTLYPFSHMTINLCIWGMGYGVWGMGVEGNSG